MARYTGPSLKLARRVGTDLGSKTNAVKAARRLSIPPGFHGRRGTRKMSDFGIQLKEKQKVKWTYGILEKQFRKYYDMATKTPAATGQEMLKILERRLDNVVYRLNFAPTRRSARQIVAHGHVTVNGHKTNIPSYLVKVGDVVALSATAQKIPSSAELLKDNKFGPPSWLQRQAAVGKIAEEPKREHTDLDINEQLIVEFYSR
jgi:small subunit ribosomal protein S4